MGFSSFPCQQNFISPIFFLRDLRPSFIADLDEQSQFERLGNDLFMNIRTNGAVPNGIKLCCVVGPTKAALESNNSTTILTEEENSGEESGGVINTSRWSIDAREDTNLTTRSNYVKHSEFLLRLPMRADEYYR